MDFDELSDMIPVFNGDNVILYKDYLIIICFKNEVT